jgi:demethylmenaquinone methyltransferase/2-methoxy-6-polyprenyl-1,4-benzoquinol methylase
MTAKEAFRAHTRRVSRRNLGQGFPARIQARLSRPLILIKTRNTMDKDPKTVQEMFGRIAGRYDLMNTLMTMGRDQSWRRFVLQTAAPPRGGSLLDVACGTGPMALMAAAMFPSVSVTAVDFTENMVRTALSRPGRQKVSWGIADGLALPFGDNSFDAVTSGYLIRNVPDPLKAFQEQARVVKPGGRVVCLDTCPPPDGLLKPAIMVHMKYVIPFLGQMVAKNRSAYEYLPDTTANFMNPQQLTDLMKQAGLKNIGFRQFMFNTQTVAWGEK